MNESSAVCHGAAQAEPAHPGWKTELPAHSIRNSFRLMNEVVTSTPDVGLAARGSVAVHSKSSDCKKARVCAAGVPTKSLRSIECVERAGCKAESRLRATNCWSIETGGWSAVWGPDQSKRQTMIHQHSKVPTHVRVLNRSPSKFALAIANRSENRLHTIQISC